MGKWLWPIPVVVIALCLTGCAGSSSTLVVGEGTGVLAADGFDPFGPEGGPINLMYLTLRESGSYLLILTSGPEQPPLPNPWVQVLGGHVLATNQSFFAAYNNRLGVLAESHGANIAQVIVTANAGDEFTFALSSWTQGTGAYSWRVTPL